MESHDMLHKHLRATALPKTTVILFKTIRILALCPGTGTKATNSEPLSEYVDRQTHKEKNRHTHIHTGPSFVTFGLLFSRVVRCHKVKQLTQNRAVRLALKCTRRANINHMHVNISWLTVEERLTSSLLVFVRSVDMLNALSCLFKLLVQTPMHTPQDMSSEVSEQSPSPEQTMEGTQYYTEP